MLTSKTLKQNISEPSERVVAGSRDIMYDRRDYFGVIWVISIYSHKIPVQFVCGHFLQQCLEPAFEEHLEAEVVLQHQGRLEAALHDLNGFTGK